MPLTTEDFDLSFKKPSRPFLLKIFGSLFLLSIFLISYENLSYFFDDLRYTSDDDYEEYICSQSIEGNDKSKLILKRKMKTIEIDNTTIFDRRSGFDFRKNIAEERDYFVFRNWRDPKKKEFDLDLIEETPSRLVLATYKLPSYLFYVLDKSSMKIFGARSSFDAVGYLRPYKQWAVLGKCQRREPLIPRTTKGFKDILVKLSKTRIKIINISEPEN